MSASEEAARAGTIPAGVVLAAGGNPLALELVTFCLGATALGSSLHIA